MRNRRALQAGLTAEAVTFTLHQILKRYNLVKPHNVVANLEEDSNFNNGLITRTKGQLRELPYIVDFIGGVEGDS